MGLHKASKGLDLPIVGAPEQRITETKAVARVAVMADDFPGMKPRFLVREGESVVRGQALFEDRKQPGVLHTAPGAGVVARIYRGERRALQSVVIELSEGERSGSAEHARFETFADQPPASLTRDQVRALLVESGAWTSFRTRPFSHTPAIDGAPAAVFVNAMDTHPLAVDPSVVIAEQRAALDLGLAAVAKLTDGPTFLCIAAGSGLGDGLSAPVQVEEFAGPHPSGTSGFHIHTLMPAHRGRVVWTVTYQELIGIGHLFRTGQVYADRVVALGGPAAQTPRLVRARVGASVTELTEGEVATDREVRRIAGSVFSGSVANAEPFAFLGRRDTQISLLVEARERKLLGWLGPGLDQYSIIPTFLSALLPKRKFAFTTETNGSPRAMVPIGMYERVMPMDILPTHLLRALLVGDLEMAEKLGALELDEEDVSLCSFVCPGKQNYGIVLRANLERAFAEG